MWIPGLKGLMIINFAPKKVKFRFLCKILNQKF